MHTLRRASAVRDNTSEYMYGKALQAKCVRCEKAAHWRCCVAYYDTAAGRSQMRRKGDSDYVRHSKLLIYDELRYHCLESCAS